jgi:16S rRNA (cytidine1402-2'-O)-methyltransferase
MNKHLARKIGMLYIVATPIGNLEDITLRAIKILQEVELILAEDTRHSKILLRELGIATPLLSFHAHNENHKAQHFVAELLAGKSMALISDAGTPLISDPGYSLVSLARQAGVRVVPIPGACALIAAISAAGVPCDAFTFLGFMPAKTAARVKVLAQIQKYAHTVIVYESVHRIEAFLDDIIAVLGPNTELVLAKELTKTFETFVHNTALFIKTWLLEDVNRCKGEFILIFPAKEASTVTEDDARQKLRSLLKYLTLKQAVQVLADLYDISRNDLYKLGLELKDGE